MGCTIHGHKNFLVICNIGLLVTGLSVLILGIKMKDMITLWNLDIIPPLLKTAKAVIASGFFIAVTGGTGFGGTCFEVLWLIYIHLGGLGAIIAVEFAVGIILMILKNTIETFMASEECNQFCGKTLRSFVLDFAMPVAGLLMTIIIVQALMICSAVQLYYYLRHKPKITPLPPGPTVLVQNMQMQNVGSQSPRTRPPQPMYPPPQPMHTASHPGYYPPYSPRHSPAHSQTHPGYTPTQQLPQPPYPISPNQPQPPHYIDNLYINPPPYSEVVAQSPGFQPGGAVVQRAVLPEGDQAVSSISMGQ